MWTALRSMGSDNKNKAVYMAIGAAYFWCIWEQRNSKAFNRGFKKEIEIFRSVQFLAFDWIRCRLKGCRTVSWENWASLRLSLENKFMVVRLSLSFVINLEDVVFITLFNTLTSIIFSRDFLDLKDVHGTRGGPSKASPGSRAPAPLIAVR
ncbi:hypothetical protein OSB04_017433 [Centaurea solstitialis]|uniref:Uncharacterized protein n=1 Tax=Centaurea solstitialis TaxID=347529 RepID=A0AA38TMV7_9ASTR|nr:hypothetical protein OSB04_017433 [Centaurea solstitialis]